MLIGAGVGLGAAAAPARAPAQERGPTLTQLAHRAWTARDGAPAAVSAIAQTADGFLWLGTSTGLYRFDGVRFERYEPPPGQTMPSGNVSALLVGRGDSLWIGYRFGGASVLAGGRLVHHAPTADGMPRSTVRQFARDSSGGIWAATQAGLVGRVGGRWRRVGAESGLPGGITAALLFDRRGTMWVAQRSGVFTRARGESRFVLRAPTLGAMGKPGMQEGPDGSVWGAAVFRGLVQLADSTGGPPTRGERASGDSSQALLFDPDGNAWLPGRPGLVWIPRSTVTGEAAPGTGRQTLSPAQGMSSTLGWTVFRDREGSIWVGTPGGLDQFRRTKLTPVLFPKPVTFPAVAAGDSGTLWVKSQTEPLLQIGARTVVHGPMPGGATCAYRDLDGVVWLGGDQGSLSQVRGGKLVRVAVPAAATANDVQAIARDRDGGLWLSVLDSGVFRRRGSVWERFDAPPRVSGPAMTIVTDRAGRTWLGYPTDRLARVVGDSVRVYSAEQGLHVGNVAALHVRGDRVWVGGEFGVMHLHAAARGPRFRPLATTDGPIRSVSGIVETAAESCGSTVARA
jgi:ligand-binding sensor domain-containing protein